MTDNKLITCAICNVEYASLASLGKHVKGTHKINGDEYYVKYLNDGIIPKCSCGNDVKFRNLNVGFSKHCSAKCSYHNPEVKALRESTNIERYGDINVFGSELVRAKITNTMLDKYGVDSIGKSTEIREKIKQTNQERYGVDSVFSINEVRSKATATTESRYGTKHAMQNEDVKKKSKETSLQRYGVEHPMQLDITKEKLYNTNMELYGVKHASQNIDIKEKVRVTNLKNNGVEYPMQSADIRSKSRESMLAKYGVEYCGQSVELTKKRIDTNISKYGHQHGTQSELVKDKIRNTVIERYGVKSIFMLDSVHAKAKKTMRDMLFDRYYIDMCKHNCEFIKSYDTTHMVSYKCNICNDVCEESIQFMYKCRLERNITPCTNCVSKTLPYSFIEKEMSDFIKTLVDNVEENTRKVIYPKELDVFIPSMKLAFEFNGVLYHNELYKSNDYHINKTVACEDKGVQLIHIYEDDWLYKGEIVKSRISNLLGKSNVIYGRKCQVREVKSNIANDFLDANHIQGKCVSKTRYGLYHLDELVALMTFGKSRFESDKIELLRYCSKLNTSITGGASKLFNYFICNNLVDEVVSYADRSWSNGNLYRMLGFDFVSCTQPNYTYVVGNQRVNRMHYQKHKLVNDGYDALLTEHEIMLSRDIYRIYDSGNLKFSYKRKM